MNAVICKGRFTRKICSKWYKNDTRYEKSVNMFFGRFESLNLKKIFSAEFRPEIDDVCQKIGLKIGQIV